MDLSIHCSHRKVQTWLGTETWITGATRSMHLDQVKMNAAMVEYATISKVGSKKEGLSLDFVVWIADTSSCATNKKVR